MKDAPDEEKITEQLTTWLMDALTRYEKQLNVKTDLDIGVLDECNTRIGITLGDGFRPNEKCSPEKIAGVMCFWLRKLKPLRHSPDHSSHKVAKYVNEIIAFQTAYFYLKSCKNGNSGTPRITSGMFMDFMAALRYHSYSPHALVQIFEALSI